MKPSINKIFKNLNSFLLTTLILSFISFLFIIQQYYSYKKYETLKNQKEALIQITDEQKYSNKTNIIQFNANISTLKNEIQSLKSQNKYDFFLQYISQKSDAYISDLDALNTLTQSYNLKIRHFYNLREDHPQKEEELLKIETIHNSAIKQIDQLIFTSIDYDNDRFNFLMQFSIVLFLLLFFMNIWYRKRLNLILSDIRNLYAIDAGKNNKLIFTQEANSINLKMKRKTLVSDNPTMMDEITEVYNNKGMLQAYNEKKSSGHKTFSCISILEIDNFSKSKRTYSQEFIKDVLKKIAYTISLYGQSSDIISRSEYNQFTLIFSRASQDRLFKDVDLIRQSISEIKFISPDKEIVRITVTGGFTMKAPNSSLEESVRKTKELLESAKQLGKNILLQSKDLPKGF